MPKCCTKYCRNKNLITFKDKLMCNDCKIEYIAQEEEPNCYLCGIDYMQRIDEGQYYDRNNEVEYAHEDGKTIMEEGKDEIKYFICGPCKIELYAPNIKIDPPCHICRGYKVGTNSIKNLKNKKIYTCNSCLPKVQEIMNVLST